MKEKVIGILGGMGSLATVDLFKKIVNLTPAKNDQEFIHIIIDNNSKIPNRRNFILKKSDIDPTPFLQSTARNLETAGADFILVACNGAHFFLEKIQDSVKIPVMSIIEEAVDYTTKHMEKLNKIGLLASVSTLEGGLYHKSFGRYNIKVIIPSQEIQNNLMKMIDSVKAGTVPIDCKHKIQSIVKTMIKNGAQCILMSCTEIPVMLERGFIDVPLLDATWILARAAVEKAKEIDLDDYKM